VLLHTQVDKKRKKCKYCRKISVETYYCKNKVTVVGFEVLTVIAVKILFSGI
jgi:hypothetical protein